MAVSHQTAGAHDVTVCLLSNSSKGDSFILFDHNVLIDYVFLILNAVLLSMMLPSDPFVSVFST